MSATIPPNKPYKPFLNSRRLSPFTVSVLGVLVLGIAVIGILIKSDLLINVIALIIFLLGTARFIWPGKVGQLARSRFFDASVCYIISLILVTFVTMR